jgi:asparagine synthase (glutamine-hydrolysing)
MSVQAGVWNFNGRPAEKELIERFGECLKNQGPDGEFSYVEGSVALLYWAFHTTSESRREKQPSVSRRGSVVTWDGRLDNRAALIAELSDYLEVKPTDVDIIAAAFDRWKTNCFRRIIGDWSVCVWDPSSHELILASDYMSIRHIFYQLKRERIWWATDLTPLLLIDGARARINQRFIAGYIANDPESHITPYHDIHQVPAGHFVRVRGQGTMVERFWHFSPQSRIRYKTDVEYEEHFRFVFRQAVRRRLRSDSPVLAELSGGLDSSSIVCMADDIIAKDDLRLPSLDTLSYFDKTEPGGDDWIYFQKIEEMRGRAGARIDASRYGVSANFAYEEFSPLPGYLGAGRMIEAERHKIIESGGYRVVLSGVGGDEFMGGVPNPSAHLADLVLRFKGFTLCKQLVSWSLAKRKPLTHLIRSTLVALLPSCLDRYFDDDNLKLWLKRDFGEACQRARLRVGRLPTFGMWLPTRRSYVVAALMMADKMSKRNLRPRSLVEVRYPFLDQDLVQFVLSIPADQLLRAGERRSLMRRALVGVVPQQILSRRTKQLGGRTSIVALERNFENVESAFASPLSSQLGFVDRHLFRLAIRDAIAGKKVNLVRIFKTIALELWLKDLAARQLIDVPARTTEALLARELHANA